MPKLSVLISESTAGSGDSGGIVLLCEQLLIFSHSAEVEEFLSILINL